MVAGQHLLVESRILCGNGVRLEALHILEALRNKMVAIVSIVDDSQYPLADGRTIKRVYQASRRTGNFRH